MVRIAMFDSLYAACCISPCAPWAMCLLVIVAETHVIIIVMTLARFVWMASHNVSARKTDRMALNRPIDGMFARRMPASVL